ncbi:MAG TPA: malto-oligosyltrehalose trehalohydrolase [Thermomicrobiales bacterium]|nr:malto-oligosyltrehalose trehalohydrolase [Thermomicrobiales bacterium]
MTEPLMVEQKHEWTLPFGANLVPDGVRFRVWAPNAARVDVLIEQWDGSSGVSDRLERREDVHEGTIAGLDAGARYRYQLDGGDAFPDPYSRFQPEGVHGPSEVVDPRAFSWSDEDWPGLTNDGLVIYECHVGTMTPEGTFAALERELPELKRLGVTAVELMPVAQCPGEHNWGYDGVDLYAPSNAYGRPDDLRRLVDVAHRIGLGLILDVVYNHLGPDGNYLRAYADNYFTDRHQTPWGDALNYDGQQSQYVRELAIANARYWVHEFHVDGFRLDATDTIIDDSPTHVVAELTARAREAAAARSIVVTAEDARNEVERIRPVEHGGEGLDGVWADDFHHEVRVLLTNARENYYQDYAGTTKAIARTINEGFGYQGEMSPNLGHARGTKVTDEPGRSFVFCIQNHDQVGNRPFGERLHHEVPWDRYAVASTLLLTAPETPLLFMGQEFVASTPFLYFTDHTEELGMLVTEGRRAEFSGFRAFSDPDLRHSIPDPQAEETFLASKLKLDERRTHKGVYQLYQDLLALRRNDQVFARQDRSRTYAAAAGAEIVAVYRWHEKAHRLVIANFGAATMVPAAGDPLLTELPSGRWRTGLTTSARKYGGSGERARMTGRGPERKIEIPARTAAVFALDQQFE